MTVTIVFHSAYGHTKAMADAVARGAAADGSHALLIPVEDVDRHWDDLTNSDAIIFGAPTYMGSASAQFKAFMDASSKPWMQQAWKDKIAAGFTISGSHSGDKLNTLTQMAVFAAQHGMVWVGLGLLPGNNNSKGSVQDLNRLGSFLGAMGQANIDQGVEGIQPSDLQTAEELGKRVAAAARRWNNT